MNNGQYAFGHPEEQGAFATRNRDFLDEIEKLWPLIERIFNKPLPTKSFADAIIYILGRMAIEDFGAIQVLAANSYGVEGHKLLRSMYEETVVMAYLSANPDEVAHFVQYTKFERWKLAKGLSDANLIFADGQNKALWDEIEGEFSEVAQEFKEPKCDKCKKGPMPSWTRKSIEEMAKKAGHNLITAYVPCYVSATKKTHVTPITVAGHIRIEEEAISFKTPPKEAYSDFAVCHAHWLLITVLEVQNEFFSLGLKEELDTHDVQIGVIWNENRKLDWEVTSDSA